MSTIKEISFKEYTSMFCGFKNMLHHRGICEQDQFNFRPNEVEFWDGMNFKLSHNFKVYKLSSWRDKVTYIWITDVGINTFKEPKDNTKGYLIEVPGKISFNQISSMIEGRNEKAIKLLSKMYWEHDEKLNKRHNLLDEVDYYENCNC